jgi:putative ABC transport system substrate-binding protein
MRALIALLALVAGGVLAAPPDRLVHIGIVMTEEPFVTAAALKAVNEGLGELGYVAGKNFELTVRTAPFPHGPMRAHVDELLAKKPDVLIAGCGWSTATVTRATKSVPVVMVAVSDPVGRGYVPSLARPGGNVTGVTSMMTELPAKLLDHLRLVLPELKTVGIALNLRNDTHKVIVSAMEPTAQALGVRIELIDLNPLASTALVREAFRRSGAQAIMMVPDDNMFWFAVDRITAAATELRLPIATFRSDVLAGGPFLMSFGANPGLLFKRTAVYADRILNGANPAEMPVELPTELEFAINLRQAVALGITIPRATLLRADRVLR